MDNPTYKIGEHGRGPSGATWTIIKEMPHTNGDPVYVRGESDKGQSKTFSLCRVGAVEGGPVSDQSASKHRRLSFMDGLVLAIAAGEKDVTRRIVKGDVDPTVCEPEEGFVHTDIEGFPCGRSRYMRWDSVGDPCEEEELRMFPVRPPYAPGDILDVCEALVSRPHEGSGQTVTLYRADDVQVFRNGWPVLWPWKVRTLPARYCPAWAVRHHRRILDVRPERLSAVTDAEAVREGVARLGWAPTREGFLAGFRELHGLEAEADPFVWRICFSSVTA